MTDVTALRLQLRRAGFHPIPVEGKAPPMKGWSQKFDTSEDEIRLWPRSWHLAVSTGVLAKFAPGLDIDIMDEEAADAVEALAREHFEEHGDIHVRFGKWPKRLVILRTDEPFLKLARVFVAPDGSEHKIEVLGDGQQYVVAGVHVQTGQPYRWQGGELETITRDSLPYVRRENMERLLDAATKLLVEEHGFILQSATQAANGGGPHEAGKEPQAAPDLIAAALAVIPNIADWDQWNAVGMATWRATGGSGEGLAAFDAWSRKSPKYDARITAEKWAAFFKSPPTHIGAGTIFHLADQASPTWRQEFETSKSSGQHQTASTGNIELVCVSEVELKAVDWLWSNHLARGKVTLLAGDSGLAKSLMTTDFAARISKGGEWPDGDEAPIGNVVILSSEDAINDTIKPRLEAAGADQRRIFCLARVKTPKGASRMFSLQTDLQQLGEKIRAIGNVVLVIIDPVTSYMGSQIDSHHTVEVRAVLEPVGRFAEEFNACVLGISHSPKAPQAKALNAVVGSGAFVHAPRLVFLAIEDPEAPGRNLLLAAKNNLGKKAEGLGYHILDDRFVGPGDSIRSVYIEWDNLPVCMTADEALAAHAEKRKGSSALGEAENFLRERIGASGVSSKDIHDEAEALGISERTLKRARKKLGVKASKDSYAEGWRLFLDKQAHGWRDRAGGKDP